MRVALVHTREETDPNRCSCMFGDANFENTNSVYSFYAREHEKSGPDGPYPQYSDPAVPSFRPRARDINQTKVNVLSLLINSAVSLNSTRAGVVFI